MKIGIIADIHSNLEALNAVLHEFSILEVKHILCCGDMIGIGPDPERTVQKLIVQPNLICVKGNHDNYLAGELPMSAPNKVGMGEQEIAHHKWQHRNLSYDSIGFLNALPNHKVVEISGKIIYISHYPIDENGNYVKCKNDLTLGELKHLFQGVHADIIVYGHSHATCVNKESDIWYINPGATGCPMFNGNYAKAGVIELCKDAIQYQQLDVVYPVNKVIEKIQRTAFPDYKTILKYFYGIC